MKKSDKKIWPEAVCLSCGKIHFASKPRVESKIYSTISTKQLEFMHLLATGKIDRADINCDCGGTVGIYEMELMAYIAWTL